jgi:hypothetical protein
VFAVLQTVIVIITGFGERIIIAILGGVRHIIKEQVTASISLLFRKSYLVQPILLIDLLV